MGYTIENLLKEKGWDTRNKFSVERRPTEHLIEAFITNDWHIYVFLDPDIEERIKDVINAYNSRYHKHRRFRLSRQKPYFSNERDNIDELIYFVVDHEIGHWEECPFDIKYERDIIGGIIRGLQKEGIPEDTIEAQVGRIANIFMDIIDNTLNCFNGFDPEKYRYGEALFYMKEGMLFGKFDDVFGVFVDSQMRMSMNDKEEREANSLAERLSRDYKTVKKLTRRVVRILNRTLNPMNYVDVDELSKIHRSRKRIIANLSDKEKWGKKAYRFARLLAPYIEEIPITSPIFTLEESATSDSENRDKNKKKDKRVGSKKGNGCGMGKRRGKERKRDYITRLDAIYRERVGQVRDISYVGDWVRGFPIKFLRFRRIKDLRRANPREIEFSRTLIDGNTLEFYERDVPLTVGRGSRGNNIRGYGFIVDSSSSMDWEPFKGEGKYDLCIRSVYSILKYLEDFRMIKDSYFCVINFSDSTNYSGWVGAEGLDNIKEGLFEHQNGNTILDPNAIRRMRNDSFFRYLAVMVSDGEISNWAEVVPEIKGIVDSGNYFVLFQLEEPSEFSEVLKKEGLDVIYVARPEDLIGLSLKRVRNILA